MITLRTLFRTAKAKLYGGATFPIGRTLGDLLYNLRCDVHYGGEPYKRDFDLHSGVRLRVLTHATNPGLSFIFSHDDRAMGTLCVYDHHTSKRMTFLRHIAHQDAPQSDHQLMERCVDALAVFMAMDERSRRVVGPTSADAHRATKPTRAPAAPARVAPGKPTLRLVVDNTQRP